MRWRTDQRTARCIRGCRRSRAVRRVLGMKRLCSWSCTENGTTEAANAQSISRWHECCSPALYAIAQNSGVSSSTLMTLARWLKSVGRLSPAHLAVKGIHGCQWRMARGRELPRAGPGTARRIPASGRAALAFPQRGYFCFCNSSNARWTSCSRGRSLPSDTCRFLTSMAAAVSVALEAACGCSTTRSARRADVARAACGPPYCVPAR